MTRPGPTPATQLKPYVTTDLYEAAYILAQGYEITIVPVSPTKRAFHFPPEAMEAASAFVRNTAVPARLYAAYLRDLKALIARPA